METTEVRVGSEPELEPAISLAVLAGAESVLMD
jgi:hypothetical protein